MAVKITGIGFVSCTEGLLSIHWTLCAELPNEAGTGETLIQ